MSIADRYYSVWSTFPKFPDENSQPRDVAHKLAIESGVDKTNQISRQVRPLKS